MINFIQHKSPKYPPRTYENASADATIAFAFDLTTPGERLTYDAVRTQGKFYIPVNPARALTRAKMLSDAEVLIEANASAINIAGNGAYTTIRYGFTQADCDAFVDDYLVWLIQYLKHNGINITLIRSGGQSGFDEAGLKAAVKLGIPALCLCPQGWRFCDVNGTTICDERQFKNRFNGVLIL